MVVCIHIVELNAEMCHMSLLSPASILKVEKFVTYFARLCTQNMRAPEYQVLGYRSMRFGTHLMFCTVGDRLSTLGPSKEKLDEEILKRLHSKGFRRI